MAHQMIFTSIERTLIGGSGYGVAAQTPNFPKILSEELPRLAGYSEIYPSSSPARRLNPVNYFHVVCNQWHVLGRITHADNDYSGRSNYIATFVALEKNELPQAGPAALLQQISFLDQYKGEAKLLPAFLLPKVHENTAGACAGWKSAAGDPGWAGHIAQRVLDRHPVSIIYGKDHHGAESLSLLTELFHLLPAEERWSVTFSTHVEGFPRGNSVRLRMLQDGASLPSDFRGGSDCFNITKPLPSRPEPSNLVNAARGIIDKVPQRRDLPTQQHQPANRDGVELVATMVQESAPPPVARKAYAELPRFHDRQDPSTPWVMYGGILAAVIASLLGGMAIGDSLLRPRHEEALALLGQKSQELEKAAAEDAIVKKQISRLTADKARETEKHMADMRQLQSIIDKNKNEVAGLERNLAEANRALQSHKNENEKTKKPNKKTMEFDEGVLTAMEKFKSGKALSEETENLIKKFKGTQLEGLETINKVISEQRKKFVSEAGVTDFDKSFTFDLAELLATNVEDWKKAHPQLASIISKSSQDTVKNIIRNYTNPNILPAIHKTNAQTLISYFGDPEKEFLVSKSTLSGKTIILYENLDALIRHTEVIKEKFKQLSDTNAFDAKEKENAEKFISFLNHLNELKQKRQNINKNPDKKKN